MLKKQERKRSSESELVEGINMAEEEIVDVFEALRKATAELEAATKELERETAAMKKS